jgi:hypothetical protein
MMARVFISHSSVENNLAQLLASWIESKIPDTSCFCSSRPADLVPGADWLKEIYERSTHSDLCLLMLSPDSASNLWIHFEAGLSLGAKISNKAVPILYGGIVPATMPSTIRHLQALDLNNQASFQAFISARFLNNAVPGDGQTYASFIGSLDAPALRLLRFGRLGLLVTENISTQGFAPFSLVEVNSEIIIPRVAEGGTIVSIRSEIMPRRQGHIEHWKFGMNLRGDPNQDNGRLFQFHAGCHQGLKSWTIYFTPIAHLPINQPAHLDNEAACKLQIWLSRDGWRIGCVGVDSSGTRVLLQTDRSEDFWRLATSNWDEIVVSGWADGAPFQIDVLNFEVDRVP